ncbi:MAG: glycosyltransferase family 2 protein, partial [Oscillospiraceae bacterium]
MKKLISIVIPTYNEEQNIPLLCEKVPALLEMELLEYNYEIIFIDNFSTDKTRSLLLEECKKNKHIKAIFNAKNFGHIRSPQYGLQQATGDCVVLMFADFQDPIELIVDFVREWEKGYKIVIGIKKQSKENKMMYFLRSCYYKTIKKIADTEQIEHFTGFGLYDQDFIQIIRELDDPMPYLRGIVGELGYQRKEINYEQQKRQFGKTKNNWYSLYDMAMIGITSYSKIIMRLATMIGFIFAGISFLVAAVYFILKLVFWNSFPLGTAPILIGIFLIGSIQLFFIGF